MRFTIITALSTMAAFALAPSTSAQLTDLQPGRNFVSSANFGTGGT